MTTNKTTKHVIVNGSVAKQVANILTKQIINEDYLVGEYLPTEEELCATFGIGRSSVREAIKTLESRGLVRKLQGKGVVVVDESIEATAELLRIGLEFHKTSLRDLMDFRVALEIKMCELASIRATDEQIDQMQKYITAMKQSNQTMEEFAQFDYLFHESIANASGNSVVILMIKTLRPLLYNQIVYTLNPNFNAEFSMHLHEKIFLAIKERKTRGAIRAMREHLYETQRIIAELEAEPITQI
ncbi:MAG: FadR/GntR family transcriptional regulator [Rikenellaceae bacterium]